MKISSKGIVGGKPLIKSSPKWKRKGSGRKSKDPRWKLTEDALSISGYSRSREAVDFVRD